MLRHCRLGIVLLALVACEIQRKGTETAVPDTATANTPDAPAPADTSWVVTATSFGPVRFGMSVAEVNAALNIDFATGTSECEYASGTLPAGTRVMIESGRVARVDVTDASTVTTAEGARIGDSEARIQSLYPGRVTVQPHKYTDGHYLVVKPAAGDTMSQIVFETDGARVTQYRAGLYPPVSWVEGCS